MPPEQDSHSEMMRLMRENQALLQENQILLQKMYRHTVVGMWIRIVWYAVLIGLPFAVYFYLLEPYFAAFGANYETFRVGMGEIPGLKGLENILPSYSE